MIYYNGKNIGDMIKICIKKHFAVELFKLDFRSKHISELNIDYKSVHVFQYKAKFLPAHLVLKCRFPNA